MTAIEYLSQFAPTLTPRNEAEAIEMLIDSHRRQRKAMQKYLEEYGKNTSKILYKKENVDNIDNYAQCLEEITEPSKLKQKKKFR